MSNPVEYNAAPANAYTSALAATETRPVPAAATDVLRPAPAPTASNATDPVSPQLFNQQDQAAVPPTHRPGRPGLRVERTFAQADVHPFDELEWELREAAIGSDKGEVIFQQKNVEVPKDWSQLATNVVVSKYFRGAVDTPDRERSVKQLVGRVADTITTWGIKDGYFQTPHDAQNFNRDLTWLLVNQYTCFNSPVWFNVGIEPRPQCSACFINSVQDSMESILDLAKTEGMLFKFGSGTGTNLSTLRSSKERLSSGGWASGPVSFMRGYDAFAGVIKSGGKTRRAAKMQILDADHPDVMDFINAKSNEERKAWALIEQGYDPSFNGEAYGSVFFQNANFSVRADDEFMRAVENDALWTTRAVADKDKNGQRRAVEQIRAREMLRKIAEGTHVCGDPGMQYHDTINKWNPVKNTGPIVASNPCSEYMFVDDSACNLASLNLMKFRIPPAPENGNRGGFDVDAFRRAVRITFIAQDILVDNSSYPTPAIEKNSHDFRPIGLGYANLGALLMARGLPYDSDEGREYAGAITAIMHGESYRTSAELAQHIGQFKYYQHNRDPFLGVIQLHRQAANNLRADLLPTEVHASAVATWNECYDLGFAYGYRNGQATVLAPTGTIAFMMDCDTTGIEPDIALVKYKKLVGGGILKIVNNTVPEALRVLGYAETEIADIVRYIDEHETIEGAPHLNDDHLPVFDCAFKAMNGVRSIHYMGHLRMMAAAQPFLSGAISKTVNMPTAATIEEIAQAYIEAWKLGLKAVAIYRDGSKRTQPLNAGQDKDKAAAATAAKSDAPATPKPARRRLPDERASITHKFSIAGHDGYITVGLYPEGQPGEIFVKMAKEGSTVSGLMDAFATACSIMLQYGVPLRVLVDKFSHMRFEPQGMTNNRQIPIAKSVMDYIFRWLSLKFLATMDERGNVAPTDNPEAEQAALRDPGVTSVFRPGSAGGPPAQSSANTNGSTGVSPLSEPGKTTKPLALGGVHSPGSAGGPPASGTNTASGDNSGKAPSGTGTAAVAPTATGSTTVTANTTRVTTTATPNTPAPAAAPRPASSAATSARAAATYTIADSDIDIGSGTSPRSAGGSPANPAHAPESNPNNGSGFGTSPRSAGGSPANPAHAPESNPNNGSGIGAHASAHRAYATTDSGSVDDDETRVYQAAATARRNTERQVFQQQADAPPCSNCGTIMIRNGSCYKCINCGTTSGCS